MSLKQLEFWALNEKGEENLKRSLHPFNTKVQWFTQMNKIFVRTPKPVSTGAWSSLRKTSAPKTGC